MDCKATIVVPEPGHSSVIVENNSEDSTNKILFELPEIISEKKRKPPVPPPVPGNLSGITSGSSVPPTLVLPPLPENTQETTPPRSALSDSLQDEEIIPLSLGKIDEDLEVLSYIYEEKHQNKDSINATLPPVPVSKEFSHKDVRRRLHWQRWIQRLKIFLFLLFLAGSGVAVWLYLTRLGPDLRLDVLKQIEQHHFNATIDARNQEIKAANDRQRAAESWVKVGELIDNYIVTFNEPEADSVDSVDQKRLHGIASDIQTEHQNAMEGEEEGLETFQQSILRKEEAAFWESQKTRIQEQIRLFPHNRDPVTMPSIPVFEVPQDIKETLRFDSDWTENRFIFFEFPTLSNDKAAENNTESHRASIANSIPFFVVPDRVHHNYPSQSLRISILKKESAVIRFSKGDKENRNLQTAQSIVFSLRFPERRSRILFGNTSESGQVGEYRIRFHNETGYAELIADAPRYCEAVFYDAQGQFFVIEVPLKGNEFWNRENHYTVAAETTDNTDNADVTKIDNDPFFQQIDSIEFSIVPRSGGCTLWLDGIMISNKVTREPYNITLAEQRQETVREEEKEYYRQRREQISVTKPASEKKQVPVSNSSLSEQTGHLLRWILQTAGGRVLLKTDGKTIALNADGPMPTFFDGVSVTEIDLSGFQRLNDEQLEQLGSRNDVKRLNLSHTGLTDEQLLKIAGMDAMEELNLSENKLTFACLPFIRTLKKLQKLHLDGIKINAKGTTSGIDGLSSLTNLRALSMAHSEIDSSDLNYLMTLADLETLDISATKIGDRGTSVLRVLPELQTLNLSETQITNAGLLPLQRLKKLRVLLLDGTSVNESSLDGIGKISSLETISVQKTVISKEGVRKVLGSVWLRRFQFGE